MENKARHDHQDQEANELVTSLRSMLLNQDIGRLDALEQRLNQIRIQSEAQDQEFSAQVNEVLVQLRTAQDRIRAQGEKTGNLEARSSRLQKDIDLLQRKAQEDAEGIVERMNPLMTSLVRRTIHDSPDEMAEALGPVMGEAIRVHIRDARQDMIDALYPIIGSTVQRAVTEFTREFQRNIDRRLKTTFGASGFFKRLGARLRGVSDAELAMRGALPFELREIFVIQRGSGLLLAHNHPGSEEIQNSEIVGAMLTAIRDFVEDSFIKNDGAAQGLDEIQYGDLRIIIESGKYAYIALVIEGIEQDGTRNILRDHISDLHTRFANSLRDYNGDPALLPNLQPGLAELVLLLNGEDLPAKLTKRYKVIIAFGSLGTILFLALACFYLQFTIALYPIAFPTEYISPTPSHTPTSTLTPTPTATATSTSTATPTLTLTPTSTPTFTPTSTKTPTPTATPIPAAGILLGNVWVSDEPGASERNWAIVIRDTPVTILRVFDGWYQIAWTTNDGLQLTGWLPGHWVETFTEIPEHYITPSS